MRMETENFAGSRATNEDRLDPIAALEHRHQQELLELHSQIEECRADARAWKQQFQLNYSFLYTLFRSPLWKTLRPVRGIYRWFCPRSMDATALQAWELLDKEPKSGPGAWIATGPGAYFSAPFVVPRGWLHVELSMKAESPGHAVLYADGGHGLDDLERLQRWELDGAIHWRGLVYASRPALGIRFEPHNAGGRFLIESLRITPVSAMKAFLLGMRNKAAAFAHPVPTVDQETSEAAPLVDQWKTDKPLNIAYVLRTASLCGGVKVVMEHCARLHARGHNVCVYHTEGETDWFKGTVRCVRLKSVSALRDVLARFRGIKVATWWETAPWVAESLRDGDRGYYLVQDIEESYTSTAQNAAEVLATYRLGLKPITEGIWTRDQLKQRFGCDSVFVSIGLDHAVFRPQLVTRDLQRILTQSRTWSGGGLKGWNAARSAILRVYRRNPQLNLATFSREHAPAFPPDLPHRHFRSLSDDGLARLYSEAGLYLLTSTHEGFGLTAAEAMACGCPVVATYAQGNEEFCIDGRTALMAPVDDAERLAQCCVRLQEDPALAAELAANAKQVIASYTWDRVIDRLEREFLQRPGPEIIIDRRPKEDHAVVSGGEYPDLRLPPQAEVDVSVVIPTVDNLDWVVRSVQSCRQYLPRDRTCEFLVVDDGTRDARTLQALHQAAEDLDFRIVLNHQNLGFSATVNHGMRLARGRVIVLCNNDIVFFQPWLEPLEAAFATDSDLGIVGAKLLYPDSTIQHAGMEKVRGHLKWHHMFAKWPADHPKANQARGVWSVTGALFAVRREVLHCLGGFSTAYGAAYEDVDYCLHAWTHGVRVEYRPEFAAYHLEGATRGTGPKDRADKPLWWTERERAGRAYFEKKWAALLNVESFAELRGREFDAGSRRAREILGSSAAASSLVKV
jgi:GT2 family glycosyltransferase/glycosyltransferase involved in cell wall biosynthesis